MCTYQVQVTMVSHTNDMYTHIIEIHTQTQARTHTDRHTCTDIHTLDILYNITKTSTKSTYSILNYAYNAILTSACLNSTFPRASQNINIAAPYHLEALKLVADRVKILKAIFIQKPRLRSCKVRSLS